MLISETYKELNKKLHEDRPEYGTSSAKWATTIEELAHAARTGIILDYGSGKGRLAEECPSLVVREYDPAIPGKDAPPVPALLVVCTDVLEHIEPECLDDVLDDLQRVTLSIGFFTVATRPAKKTLADGRNAHLIQQKSDWWLPKIMQRFALTQFNDLGGEFLVIVRKK